MTCGTDNISLRIALCPIYYEGFNESLMALNAKFNDPVCYGVADLEARTPVLKFNVSIISEELSLCGNNLEVRSPSIRPCVMFFYYHLILLKVMVKDTH